MCAPMTRLEGVPETCPHCHRPTHGILFCGCGRLTVGKAAARSLGLKPRKAHKGQSDSERGVARRRTKMDA
jgi:hypothetical protein